MRGEKHKVVLFGNRNAFYYVLDRNSGKFLTGRQFAKQSWAKGLDDSGKAVVPPGSSPTTEGAKIYPDLEWRERIGLVPLLVPHANLFFVAARIRGGIYLKGNVRVQTGRRNSTAAGRSPIVGDPPIGFIRALNLDTGELKREFKLNPMPTRVCSTAGKLAIRGNQRRRLLRARCAHGPSGLALPDRRCY